MTDRLPNGYTHRFASLDDAERVASLWNDRSEAIAPSPLRAASRTSRCTSRIPDCAAECAPGRVLKNWDHPKFNLTTDSRLVFAPDGALIGYAHVRDVKDPPVDVFAGYSVHPDHDEAEWLWDDLFSWMEAEARRVIPKAPEDALIALVAGTSEQDATEQRELERHGFEYSRTFHRMRTTFTTAPDAPRWPNGFAVRPVVPGEDDVELVTAHREAFADHYGILRQPFETDLEE